MDPLALTDKERFGLRRRRKLNERLLAIQQLKAGQPCVGCGQSFPYYVMDFDHRDPNSKTFQISSALKSNVAWDRILGEIAKCDLRCANCHRLRSEGVRVGHKVYHTRAWHKDKAFVDDLKYKIPCADCVRLFKPCQMDFDHVRGEKVEQVSRLIGDPRLRDEITKCELVCANCHRVRTWGHLPARQHQEVIPSKPRGRRGPYRAGKPAFRPWHILVGTMPDAQIAKRVGLTLQAVREYRMKQGMPVFNRRAA